jgi:hypothetical protein
MILEIARLQMQEQFESSDSIDTKAAGILGFTGVALGALLAAGSSLGKGWWLPTIGLALSALSLWCRRRHSVWRRLGSRLREWQLRRGRDFGTGRHPWRWGRGRYPRWHGGVEHG